MTTHIDFPLVVSGRGRTATADRAGYLRDLIEQVLFTAPGERVNRPTFGCGVLQLVFAPLSDTLVTATQAAVQGALSQWLADEIAVEAVEIERRDSALVVSVSYVDRLSGERQRALFQRAV
jgi:hypothetical protein